MNELELDKKIWNLIIKNPKTDEEEKELDDAFEEYKKIRKVCEWKKT